MCECLHLCVVYGSLLMCSLVFSSRYQIKESDGVHCIHPSLSWTEIQPDVWGRRVSFSLCVLTPYFLPPASLLPTRLSHLCSQMPTWLVKSFSTLCISLPISSEALLLVSMYCRWFLITEKHHTRLDACLRVQCCQPTLVRSGPLSHTITHSWPKLLKTCLTR